VPTKGTDDGYVSGLVIDQEEMSFGHEDPNEYLDFEDEVFVREEQACVSEVNFGNSKVGKKTVIKWLLDTGASIHAEINEKGVINVKPCNSKINIADGNTITPKGVGAKTIYDYETGRALPIKQMHVMPEFAKRILSVLKLIDAGFEVQFLKDHAIIKDKERKSVKCPRDTTSGLYYLWAQEEENVLAVTETEDMENPVCKNVVREIDMATGLDKKETVSVKMPKSVDVNEAHDVWT
jgi:hypothetical protein